MKSFEELGVREDILKAIAELGFESPMPVQEQVIPHLLNEDGDVVALAQTGTGKTAAFGLPVLQRTDTDKRVPQALIISPTRELCLQIASDLADFSKYINGLRVLPVYGGSSIESQIRTLKSGVQIIVATPGRLLDLIKRNTVNLSNVHTVILDEADEMLNMGFLDDINDILAQVPDDRKMLMFSATMPQEIARIAKTYMHNPTEIVIGTLNEGTENVRHIYYMVNARDKYLALKRIADYNPNIYGIIFTRTRREAQEIADKLIEDGYNADSLHGELSQAQRDTVMKKFRDHSLQLLVATDVAARGLDVNELTHVINYGLPDDTATYTHRSGRTGRAGKTGVSIALIHSRERGKLREIEKKIGRSFERKEVPSPKAIMEKQLFNLADGLEKVKVDEEAIAPYMQAISRKLEWLSEEDLLKRVLSLEMNRLLAYYKDAKSLDIADEPRRGRDRDGGRDSRRGDRDGNRGDRAPRRDRDRAEDPNKDSRKGEPGYDRVYISAGKQDGMFPANIIEIINQNVKGRVEIGRIDLMPRYALFDVKEGEGSKVANALKSADFYGRRLFSEIAQEGKDYSHSATRKKNVGNDETGSDDDFERPRRRYGSDRSGRSSFGGRNRGGASEKRGSKGAGKGSRTNRGGSDRKR